MQAAKVGEEIHQQRGIVERLAVGRHEMITIILIFEDCVNFATRGGIKIVIGIHLIQQPVNFALRKAEHRLEFWVKRDDAGDIEARRQIVNRDRQDAGNKDIRNHAVFAPFFQRLEKPF